MPFTTYMDNAILNEFFGGTNYVPPANLFVALSKTAPTKGGTNVTEPVGSAYTRVQLTNNATNFPGASNSTKSNGTIIAFPEATGDWGTITHYVVYDAVTGGNALAFGALTASKTIESGDTPSFSIGSLSISLS